MIKTAILFDDAAIAVKMSNIGKVVQYIDRRPYSSERGAASMGPIVKPNVYNDTPRTATSLPTLKRSITKGMAGTNVEVPTVLV